MTLLLKKSRTDSGDTLNAFGNVSCSSSSGRISTARPVAKVRYGVFYSSYGFANVGAEDTNDPFIFTEDDGEEFFLSPGQRRRMAAAVTKQKKAQKRAAAAAAATTAATTEGGSGSGFFLSKKFFGRLAKLIHVKNAFCSSKNASNAQGGSKKYGKKHGDASPRDHRKTKSLMSLNWAINNSATGQNMYLATAGIPPISASVVPMPTIAEESESELEMTIHRFNNVIRTSLETIGDSQQSSPSSSCCAQSSNSEEISDDAEEEADEGTEAEIEPEEQTYWVKRSALNVCTILPYVNDYMDKENAAPSSVNANKFSTSWNCGGNCERRPMAKKFEHPPSPFPTARRASFDLLLLPTKVASSTNALETSPTNDFGLMNGNHGGKKMFVKTLEQFFRWPVSAIGTTGTTASIIPAE